LGSLVLALLVAIEEGIEQWVPDWLAGLIESQVSFCHVGGGGGSVDEHVVPGLIPRGSRAGDLFIPLVAALEGGIDIGDDAAIVESAVVNDLADTEFSL